jgi:hypothetical protein
MLVLKHAPLGVLCGPGGSLVYVFIDDVNTPEPEESGAQPPLELIRQYLDSGGLFTDLDDKRTTHTDGGCRLVQRHGPHAFSPY